jgi:N-glycosylase/DNA lyase
MLVRIMPLAQIHIPPRLKIPQEVMNTYDAISRSQTQRRDWRDIPEQTLWESLALCILSSNVHFDTAKSAADQLRYKGILASVVTDQSARMIRVIATELQRPIYLPRRIDGSFRRYRFPNVRARNLVNAARSIYGAGGSLQSLLGSFNSNEEARRFLSTEISGLGLKEASHFLRNIGYCVDLAIIDVHVVSFLKELALIDHNDFRSSTITAKIYGRLEAIMRWIASTLGVNLAIFDIAVWNYMRTKRWQN